MSKSKGARPTRAQQKDEQVLATILAAAEQLHKEIPGKVVRPHWSHDSVDGSQNGFGIVGPSDARPPDGPCCAVGAGVLYSDTDRKTLRKHSCEAFARLHGVDYWYASGVSLGFETPLDTDVEELTINQAPQDTPAARGRRASFRRGYVVGRTAFEILFDKGANEP